MKIYHIAAMGENRVIGRDGTQPFFFDADLARFKELTVNHFVVMGRKTFENLPVLLKDRHVAVLSTGDSLKLNHKLPEGGRTTAEISPGKPLLDGPRGAVHVAGGVPHALSLAEEEGFHEVYIAGGGEVYEDTLPLADELRLTLVHDEFEGDTFYPELNAEQWKVAYQKPGEEYSFVDYSRTQGVR